MVELFIALRHLKKRKFQTIISVIAISLALIVFVTSTAISDGLTKNTLNSLLSLNPHLTVRFYEQNDDDYLNLIENIKDDNIVSKNPSIDIKGFIKYDGQSIIPLIKAQDIKDMNLNVVSGKITLDDKSVIIGEELRKNLGVNIGEKINILSLNGREISLPLSATFKTGFLPYDSNLVIIPLKMGMILNENGSKIDSLNINVKNPSDLKSLRKLSNKIELGNDNVYSYTWDYENANLLSAIKIEKFILLTILSFLFIIASFVVAVILNISVREKTNDIGILKAFGYTKKNILKIFIYEGIFVGLLGIIVSIILTPIILILLKLLFTNVLKGTYYISGLPVVYNMKEILIIYLSSLVIVFLASIIPAKKAANLDVTEALRFNL